MVKKALVKDRDQFIVRLPKGMRERIKAKAEIAGMSMNEAIVECLERYFPTPVSLEEKLDELSTLAAMLKKGGSEIAAVQHLIDQLHDTVEEIADGAVEAPPNFRMAVSEQLERWNEEQAERYQYLHENPFDMPAPVVWTPGSDGGGDLDDED